MLTKGDPDISPDKKKVVFGRYGPIQRVRPGVFNNEYRDWAGLYAINVDGTSLRQITTLPNSQSRDIDPIWSPDGNDVVFMRNDWSNGTTNRRLLRVNEKGEDVTTLFEVPDPKSDISNYEFSPDSSKVAINYNNSTFVVEKDGNNLKEISTGSDDPSWGKDEYFIWLPNSRQLIVIKRFYPSTGGFSSQKYLLVDVDGSNSRDIADICPLDQSPPDF